MGKGEIARYEQFLLFPQCFQKACFLGASKGVIVWEWVNSNQMKDLSREKGDLVGIVKSIDAGQTARTALSDQS